MEDLVQVWSPPIPVHWWSMLVVWCMVLKQIMVMWCTLVYASFAPVGLLDVLDALVSPVYVGLFTWSHFMVLPSMMYGEV